ncbi:hypothetical protein B8W69_02855 [Mycobacterium vulneris]|uniref:Uncharacterized protein n=1 Tax=Mycolicibacterium vulneris TaxID=547163 RepID=A0A1X2LEZ2_9MYCO|nr:hypothetical protein [Mycolicibacterium vulneris]OSC32053.1 hypothetical protein B8W69_02855 [Mycolicibacterium vulneris]
MSQPGLTRVGGVVVLSGPALKEARDAALIAAKHRKRSGIPYLNYQALACEFGEAMAADGHSDVRSPSISKAVAMDRPALPLAEAADRLGISLRQARRVAPQLGGDKIAGCWFVDETALNEHIEGRQ